MFASRRGSANSHEKGEGKGQAPTCGKGSQFPSITLSARWYICMYTCVTPVTVHGYARYRCTGVGQLERVEKGEASKRCIGVYERGPTLFPLSLRPCARDRPVIIAGITHTLPPCAARDRNTMCRNPFDGAVHYVPKRYPTEKNGKKKKTNRITGWGMFT